MFDENIEELKSHAASVLKISIEELERRILEVKRNILGIASDKMAILYLLSQEGSLDPEIIEKVTAQYAIMRLSELRPGMRGVSVLGRIIRITPAQKDQDHIRVIIYNNPKIPDRTAAILGKGPNPLPEMIETARKLEEAGADFIIIPCNTAHYYYEELRKNVGIPILNMIELTSQKIAERFPQVKKVGLIGTTGTVKARLYDRALERRGIQVIYPPEGLQNKVMEAIYDNIKAGRIREGKEIMGKVAKQLIKEGAEIIICGCTEVSLVLRSGDIPVPLVDPLQILAEVAVAEALRDQ
mgnify:CR=1 FL=1